MPLRAARPRKSVVPLKFEIPHRSFPVVPLHCTGSQSVVPVGASKSIVPGTRHDRVRPRHDRVHPWVWWSKTWEMMQKICIRRVKRKRRRISSNMKQMGTMGLKSRSRKCIEYGYPHIWFGTKARGLDHIYRGKKPKIEKLKKCMTRSVFN